MLFFYLLCLSVLQSQAVNRRMALKLAQFNQSMPNGCIVALLVQTSMLTIFLPSAII